MHSETKNATRTQRKILIAEDDIDDQDLLIEALLSLDSSLMIHVEDSGEKALNYLHQLPEPDFPNLIILDYNLPRFNGHQILQLLNGEERLRPLTKVVWSTSNSPMYQEKCLREGAMAYLVKPTDLNGIRKVAEVMLAFCLPKATLS